LEGSGIQPGPNPYTRATEGQDKETQGNPTRAKLQEPGARARARETGPRTPHNERSDGKEEEELRVNAQCEYRGEVTMYEIRSNEMSETNATRYVYECRAVKVDGLNADRVTVNASELRDASILVIARGRICSKRRQ
jgi:hypothetical protein